MPSSNGSSKASFLLISAATAALLAAFAAPASAQSGAAPVTEVQASAAEDERAYRKDAAKHLYGKQAARIWKGRMPPLLHAVGVLQVELDQQGMVQNVTWMRAPNHAPDVMAEIEKMVRSAAPFPAPSKLGQKVTYTDVWLWHKSGRFQLDTLTEGQD